MQGVSETRRETMSAGREAAARDPGQDPARAQAAEPPPLFAPRYLAGIGAALVLLLAAITSRSVWFLNFVHVLAGVLWTGIDLFMGFVIGPILRRIPPEARRSVIARLTPVMTFLMPTLAIVTGTAGYVLAGRIGYLDLAYPAFAWVVAALTIIALLIVQGMGLLLPLSLMVFFELRKPAPDGARIWRLMRIQIKGVALQGLLQVAILVVMARFVTGF